MLRIEGRDATSLNETTLEEEDLQEDDLREWLIRDSAAFIGDDLLVIGREVDVEGVGDGIDVLGIDHDGNLVTIELKRGTLRGRVDFQSLKYASYVSRWGYGDVKSQFERFVDTEWGRRLYDDTDFTEAIDEFCNEGYEVNGDQRVVFVGDSVRERIGSVVLWLREQGVNASIVEFTLFVENDDSLYLDAGVTIPTPTNIERFEIGGQTANEPWKDGGRRWHLNERANEGTRSLLKNLIDELSERDLEGPHWNQKYYVAFRVSGRNRVLLFGRKDSVQIEVLDFDATAVTEEQVVNDTGFEPEEVLIEEDQGERNLIRINCPPNADLDAVVTVIDDLAVTSTE